MGREVLDEIPAVINDAPNTSSERPRRAERVALRKARARRPTLSAVSFAARRVMRAPQSSTTIDKSPPSRKAPRSAGMPGRPRKTSRKYIGLDEVMPPFGAPRRPRAAPCNYARRMQNCSTRGRPRRRRPSLSPGGRGARTSIDPVRAPCRSTRPPLVFTSHTGGGGPPLSSQADGAHARHVLAIDDTGRAGLTETSACAATSSRVGTLHSWLPRLAPAAASLPIDDGAPFSTPTCVSIGEGPAIYTRANFARLAAVRH